MRRNLIFIGIICLTLIVMLSGLFITNSSIAVNKEERNKTKEIQQVKNEEENKIDNNNELEKLRQIKSNPFFILVNRENSLDESYEGNDLVECDFPFISYITTTSLNREAANAAKRMFAAAEEEGIYLLGASGYRTYAIQESLYYGRVQSLGVDEADKYTAKPGQSEHETGLALDILSKDYQEMDDNFDTTSSYNWLVNNCYKYGFILRYLKGKEDITGYAYEPWHYRYIGNEEIAQYIMENQLTFEEYMDELDLKIKSLQ